MSATTTSAALTIYCPGQGDPSARLHQPAGWSPSWTGEIAVDTLEEIFLYFNRIDDHDTNRLKRCGYHLPSLSVEDIIIRQLPAGVSYHLVAHFGFNELTEKKYLAIRRARHPQLAALRRAT